uniref:Uncharacterized protein n=1 Tax=Triticum urartu TaxID=4572 RepID=A0A8R7USV9_TRIUA
GGDRLLLNLVLLLIIRLLEDLALELLPEGARLEARRLGAIPLDELRHRAQQHGVGRRLGEDDPGDSHGLPVDEHAVEHAGVAPVAEDLQRVADVDHERARLVTRGDPGLAVAGTEDLQARHAVGEDEGERGHVGVRLHAHGQLRLRAPRVVVDLELQQQVVLHLGLAGGEAEAALEGAGLDAEPEGEDGEEPGRERAHVLPEALGDGHVLGRVCRPERVVGAGVGVEHVQQVVLPLPLPVLAGGSGEPAAVPLQPPRRRVVGVGLLVLDRHAEEPRAGAAQCIDEILRDAVTGQVHDAPVLRGGAHGVNDGKARWGGRVRGVEGGHVDDGDSRGARRGPAGRRLGVGVAQALALLLRPHVLRRDRRRAAHAQRLHPRHRSLILLLPPPPEV